MNTMGKTGAALAAAVLAAAAVAAEAPSDARWVSGSRVNLRREPQPGAPVVATLTTNTRVQLTGRSGSWCAVRTVPEAGEPVAGHVACELLASTPLKLEDLEATYAAAVPRDGSPPEYTTKLQDVAARAFWISPALGRWETYARGVALPPMPAEGWTSAPRVVPNAEFDAMNALLASGRLKVDRPPAPQPANQVAQPEGAIDKALRRAPLPVAAPSFFAGAADFDVPVPSGWTLSSGELDQRPGDAADAAPYAWGAVAPDLRLFDALSHRFGAAMKVTRMSPWEVDNYGTLIGLAGIGMLDVAFAAPVAIEALARDGRVVELPVAEATFSWGEGGCRRGGVSILKPARPPGAPNMDGFVVAWVGRKPPAARATITSRALDGKTRYDKLVIHAIDLDADRKPDFMVYEGRYEPQISATGLWQAVYANVAGQWRLVYADNDDDCT